MTDATAAAALAIALKAQETADNAGGSIPAIILAKSSNATITTATLTKLGWNSETRKDTGFSHDNTTNNERLIFDADGLYAFGAFADFSANATGGRLLVIRKNGGSDFVGAPAMSVAANPSSISTRLTAVGLAVFSAGDYLEASVRQDAGTDVIVYGPVASGTPACFWAVKLA